MSVTVTYDGKDVTDITKWVSTTYTFMCGLRGQPGIVCDGSPAFLGKVNEMGSKKAVREFLETWKNTVRNGQPSPEEALAESVSTAMLRIGSLPDNVLVVHLCSTDTYCVVMS